MSTTMIFAANSDERDEVADYEQNYDWNNHPLDYDLVYYTDFCHFEEV